MLDRFIQRAMFQVLKPDLDREFCRYSYGFRPGRSTHEAACAAERFVQQGRRWVAGVDLEKSFDRVNHDVLTERLSWQVGDCRVLVIIHRYLEAGILAHGGVVTERHEGTLQGGPLSPLPANALLDDVNKERERRGRGFVRYADDCNVYVRSRRSSERVMLLLRRVTAGLKLRVNESKSAVEDPLTRSEG